MFIGVKHEKLILENGKSRDEQRKMNKTQI